MTGRKSWLGFSKVGQANCLAYFSIKYIVYPIKVNKGEQKILHIPTLALLYLSSDNMFPTLPFLLSLFLFPLFSLPLVVN